VPRNIQFYITDHSPDRYDTGNPNALNTLYRKVRAVGISSVRFDMRWKTLVPKQERLNREALLRYAEAVCIMDAVGLESPTIVLSSIPPWALEVYKKDPRAFFRHFGYYLDSVRSALQSHGHSKPVERFQVLNELNNKIYTPVDAATTVRMFDQVAETLRAYNPHLKLVGSFLAGNFARLIGTSIETYLDTHQELLRRCDVVAIDYYPGVWHWDFAGKRRNGVPYMFQMELLQRCMRKLAQMGKEYEIGEVGFPTSLPWLSKQRNERLQRYFFDHFFRLLRLTLDDLGHLGLPPPSRVGIYQAIDEPPHTVGRKLLRALTPFPEHDFGLWRSDGAEKLVVAGEPQLRRLIGHLNA
jgi:hypothetical protein